MAAEKELFTDRESLRNWLVGKPDGWAPALATRALLRTLLEPWQINQPASGSDLEVKGVVYRVAFVCWVALRYGRKDLRKQIAEAFQVANDLAENLAATAKTTTATPQSILVHVAANTAASFISDPARRGADAVAGAEKCAVEAHELQQDLDGWSGLQKENFSTFNPWNYLVEAQDDAAFLAQGPNNPGRIQELFSQRLWRHVDGNEIARLWQYYSDNHYYPDQHVDHPWRDWHKAVIFGEGIYDTLSGANEKKLLLAWARISDEDWVNGIDHVNKLIAEIERKHGVERGGSGGTGRKNPPPVPGKIGNAQTPTLDDAVDGGVDYLDRADTALVLAGRLNSVWDLKNAGPVPHSCPRYLIDVSMWWRRLFRLGNTPLKPGYVVHLDAPWGGGKSSFAGFVAGILNPWRLKGDLPDWLKELNLQNADVWDKGFRRPWYIVNFNAWQHQHVSPPWWTFYQAIRKQCLAAMRDEYNRHKMPVTIWQRIGDWCLTPLRGLYAKQWPWVRWLISRKIRNRYFEVSEDDEESSDFPIRNPEGPLAYRLPVMRWWHWLWCSVSELVWRLMTPKFLTTIGISLVSGIALYFLLKSGLLVLTKDKLATPPPAGDAKVAAEAAAKAAKAAGENAPVLGTVMSAIIALLLGGAGPLMSVFTLLTSTLFPGTPDAAKNYAAGSGDPLERFRVHFDRMIARFQRPVLVVVDDLDRCKPEFVVELVRGMQTILVSPRIVFLLLGDRDWIEKAFAEVHKSMKGIDVGPQHEFGARFVEKAIQFSFVLPDIDKDQRAEYVRRILYPEQLENDEPEIAANVAGMEKIKREQARVLAIDSFEVREEEGVKLDTLPEFTALSKPQQQAVKKDFARQKTRRAVSDTSVREGTAHMLEALVPVLPANPRQIKRIINALSVLQLVARLHDDEIDPGSPKWRLLARWVVLMTEWPKTWFTLSKSPDLADKVLKFNPKAPGTNADPLVVKIAGQKIVMDILKFEEVDFDAAWKNQPLNTAAVSWLADLVPATSGQPLTVEKPAEDKAGKTGGKSK